MAATGSPVYYRDMTSFNRFYPRAALAMSVLLCVMFGIVQAATPAPIKLTAEVGPGFTITLKKANKLVVTLKKGVYSITVRDRSTIHNFHLFGPGVSRSTPVARSVTSTWTVTLRPGTYTYQCDPHASSGMKASFRVTL